MSIELYSKCTRPVPHLLCDTCPPPAEEYLGTITTGLVIAFAKLRLRTLGRVM